VLSVVGIGYYEILQDAMEQGLKMNSWGTPNPEFSYDDERYELRMNECEWMNECNVITID
jgi:hypothetical protein